MAHALRYFCSWQSERYKHQMRLELWEKDYKGEATAMVLSGEPKLTMEEGDTICGSSLDFGLLSETNGQYLHLYTTDNHKYLIKILRDGAVMWEGYLLPEYYSEAYIAAPYTVSFTATDWLGMLKNVDFPAEDTRVPILQIIKTCLQYTELPLDFACQLDMRVEGINDTTNVLGALYLNPMTFTGYNCYEVLGKILASFNATLHQTGHRWLISSIDDELPLRLISWDSLSYTGDGESNNGEVIGTNFAGTFIDGSMTMAIEPAKKSVDLSQDIFYRESWLKDYDFHSADAWELHGNILKRLPGWLYTKNPDNGELIKQTYVEYLRVKPLTILADNNYISQVINVKGAPDNSEFTLGIKFLTPTLLNGDNTTVMYVKIINRASTSLTQDVAYLSVNGWTNEDSEIELNGTSTEPKYLNSQAYYDKDGNLEWVYKKDNWPITKINFISIPYSGTLEVRIRLRDIAIYEEKHPLNPHFTHYFGGVYLTKTNVTKNLTISSSLNPDAAETASSVNLMLCDSPEERNVELGVLNYFSLSDGALTTGKKWYYNGQEYEDFLHAIAYSYSRCYANKRQKLSGALYTDKIYNLCSFTDKWSGKRHTIKSWLYSIISERLDSMEIIETPAKEIELTLSTPEAGSSNKQNQPSGGTSGGGATSMAGSGRYVNLDTAQEVSGEKTWNDNANFKKNINVAGDGIFGGEVSGIVGEGTPAGVTDYSALTGKPSINGKELASGNNTLDELGIQPKGDYTTASQLATTLENYATKVFVSNNYAGKSAFNAHIADNNIHITAAERDAWNAKWNYNEATIKAVKVNSASSADSVAWSGIKDKPTTIAGYGITDAYTSSTIDSKLSGYLPLSGGTLTGSVTMQGMDTNLIRNITYTSTSSWARGLMNLQVDGISKFSISAMGDYTLGASDNGIIYAYIGCNPYDGLNLRISATSLSWGNNSILHAGNYNSYSPKLDGTGASGTWGIDISGNASSATKLQTPRTLWGKLFDGSANVDGDLTNVGNITASGKATIQGDIVCGGEVAVIAGEGTPAGVTDYSALTGKPSINGVTLVSGNNTLASLGIQAAGDYATNSGVTTLLANYADKTFVSNNYVGKSAFNSHTADSDIHITAAERAAWNAKWDYDEATIKAVKVTSASSADSVAWSGISGKPSTFTPSAHTHPASDVSGLPTSLKNPYALSFGSKTYDGSAAATITASDLGALTAHQSIYALTLQVNGTSKGVYNPASAAKTINIAVPTKTSDITNDSGFITSAAIPTALKNPYAIEIKANGVSLGTYDGSAAATFNLSAANVGAANKVHTHTASDISGLPTNLSAFTNDVGFVTVRQKNGFSYNNLNSLYVYNALIYRIDLTDVQVNIWTMLFIEVSLRQHYSHGYAGKILINLYHGSASDFNGFNATILGTLQNINVYGSDRRYIYIYASMSYPTISVDRVLVGDNAINYDLSNITIEKVDSLPDTYQTATIYNGLHSGNYNSYAPTLTGTGASGTWGISISGNAASATKLQDNTAFTVWGQKFFENGKPKNVNGDAHITGDLIVDGEVSALVA